MSSWLTNDRVDLGLLTATAVVTVAIVGIVFGEMMNKDREILREAARETTGPGMYYSPEMMVLLGIAAVLVVYAESKLPDDADCEDTDE